MTRADEYDWNKVPEVEVTVMVWDGSRDHAHQIVKLGNTAGRTFLYVEPHPLTMYEGHAARPSIFHKLPSGLYKRFYPGDTVIVCETP